ncbi:hypothetical protein JTF06_05330 [Desemzia sp. RIT804]|uniref:hypothetical protein n=1 Tax=Desemzia sp. RIT 804 TaxID=2810209 RepID=UPI00194FA8EF|nr:hypothetical protein [Desemzia sp. RIT 804]MBM6614308.1 hypothetical protein [Desemzia sp. RIT 804]
MGNTQSDEEEQLIDSFKEGYKDRNMAKWQGFILSDHTDLLKEKEQRSLEHSAKEKQSLSVVSDFLQRSFAYGHQLAIQLDFIVNGSYEPDIIGVVTGYENELIYVQTDEEIVVVDLSLIRHINILSAAKWFNSDVP